MATQPKKTLPSSRWTSADSWDYNGMKERIEDLLQKLDKSAIVRNAESILDQKLTLSEPFSAGQYWVCFELVGQQSDLLVIARVRLPKHPDLPDTLDYQAELRSVRCEVETMRYVKYHLPNLVVPEVYAYAGPSSKEAEEAGAVYMLIQGFYGNTLQDVEFDMTTLPIKAQEQIITQWTAAQVALASLSFSAIGSIHSFSTLRPPELGPLSSAALEGLEQAGPFSNATSYFKNIARARYSQACRGDESLVTKAAILIFMDVVENTMLFTSEVHEMFPLAHMDMGTQNLLVDDDFNLLAVIDWEFAQTAPWQTHHYPMPFPLTSSDQELDEVLQQPDHVAYSNVSRQVATQKMYREKMKQAEDELTQKGQPLAKSIAESLNGPASRIYACLERLSGADEHDEALMYEMARLAYGLDSEEIKAYIDTMKEKASKAISVVDH